ncbi:MAG: META domain-containing protein [Acidimicrobiales bacterium]
MELTLLPGGDEAPPGDPATTTTTTDGLVATTAPETTVPESTVSAQPPSTTTTTVPGPTVPAKPPSTTTITDGSGGGSADGFFGYEWHVVSVAGEGANREFRGAVVDTRTAGVVTISGCNGAGGAMRLEGDRLVKNGDWAHTAMACLPTGDGEDLMAQDAWYEAFLTDGPTVAAPPDGFGSAIILDTGTATVHLERP